eukprot:PhF_6_TR13329/c0_g1_i2/m.21123
MGNACISSPSTESLPSPTMQSTFQYRLRRDSMNIKQQQPQHQPPPTTLFRCHNNLNPLDPKRYESSSSTSSRFPLFIVNTGKGGAMYEGVSVAALNNNEALV